MFAASLFAVSVFDLGNDYSWTDRIVILLVEAAVFAIVFFLGSSIGSFLNVVAYRLPRRMNLFLARSHCPICRTPILPRDNVPLLGWAILRGRCRSCRAPISIQYPLVEAGVGLLFLFVFYLEAWSGGATLPLLPPSEETGTVGLFGNLDLLRVCASHLVLFSFLASLALIRIRGDEIPWRLPALGVVLAAFLAFLWPVVQIPIAPGRWMSNGALPSLAGAVVGCVVGGVLGLLCRGEGWRPGVAMTLGVAGAFLGWQAVLWVAACTLFGLVIRLAVRPLRRVPGVVFVLLGTMVLLASWRWLSQDGPRPDKPEAQAKANVQVAFACASGLCPPALRPDWSAIQVSPPPRRGTSWAGAPRSGRRRRASSARSPG